MSVFDLPRLHFSGTATTHAPTGARSGLVDLATNTALTADGQPFPPHRPPGEYHDHLDRIGPRYDSTGRPAPDGPFSAAKGEDFAGNGHFAVDARIVGVECRAGDLDTRDPVIGRAVDMWGHYNEYLGTTVNRARVFDVDPASDWTTTLMVGQFCFGRDGRSHDVGYMATGAVHGFHPPRWHNSHHVRDVGEHWLAKRLRRSVVHQFVVAEDDELTWLDEAAVSPAVRLLRDTVACGEAGGLVVQFALGQPSAPEAPDRPSRWRLRGTIAPWRPCESRTYPAGRLLVPNRPGPCGPHNLTVELTDDHAMLNMITAMPVSGSVRDGRSEAAPLDLGDLELRTADSGRLVARVPRQTYLGEAYALAGGLVTVPIEMPAREAAEEALHLVGTGPDGPVVHLREKEVTVQADDAALMLEHPRDADDADHDVEVLVRSFVRGRPAAVGEIGVRQFFNPRALPRDPVAASPDARSSDVDVVRVRAGRRGGDGAWSSTCVLGTDDAGRGWFTLRGAAAGTARVLLSTGPDDLPCDPDRPGSATLGYDHDDALGYWPGAGYLAVRVLPDDWRLAGTGQDEVTFDLVYEEVFAFYEHTYSFMKAEVFSLADRCKVETYAKLIWQMCDPRNKSKTYYMPPTRELSEPKAQLLLTFLRAQQKPDEVLSTVRATSRRSRRITTRDQLVEVLRDAAAIELAVMLQYLYAAYSVPTHGAGAEYVRRGLWTSEQLRLACGDGGETLDEGIRSMLLDIAREEMIHFLLVNNILIAVGEPFHVPRIDFGTVNHELAVPLDFSLERLGPGSVERFVQIERPEGLVEEVRRGDGPAAPAAYDERHPYGSLSELYADLREGLKSVPDLFMVDKGRGGGEHHLFLRKSLNRTHPDYQLEVDDLASALFAVDVITEQGEGGVLGPRGDETSHYHAFLRISELLRSAPTDGPHPGAERWNPAYPVVRNPTLGPGNPATETVTDAGARAVMKLFNRAYFMALQLMAQHFGECPDAALRRSDLMNAAIDMMTGLMRPLAELLVTMPSGRRGMTAGPSFELLEQPMAVSRPDVARRGIARRLDELATECGKHPVVPARVGEMSAFWADHFRPPGR
ncbi:ferritin-like domain-containing protein [Streptomyces sp. WMMC940]|uniref:ferritin-like domain-containing protein n=1 Tax=Streptomyces sp. WMMC940 TaxID=3015153 RepID=UPI0022B73602|nr:ferritin-like domain-containing protein [Streptomyces sp. WMMC940]MCZ7462192.1 ferritin-like domain-containing protein [Streptomyces sp. WMMC940]